MKHWQKSHLVILKLERSVEKILVSNIFMWFLSLGIDSQHFDNFSCIIYTILLKIWHTVIKFVHIYYYLLCRYFTRWIIIKSNCQMFLASWSWRGTGCFGFKRKMDLFQQAWTFNWWLWPSNGIYRQKPMWSDIHPYMFWSLQKQG